MVSSATIRGIDALAGRIVFTPWGSDCILFTKSDYDKLSMGVLGSDMASRCYAVGIEPSD